MTDKPLDIPRLGDLCEAFSQSDLPFQVDIVDWASVSESFRGIIKKECVVVLSKSQEKPDKNNKWSTMSLGDCAILSHQTILPSDAVGLPYIGLEHIAKDQMHLIGTGKASDVSSVKIRFDCKDILFGKLRPYFRKIIMAPFEGICSTDIWVIKSREGVDQSFLFYCLASKSFIDFATRSSDGTRMPRAKWDYVSQYKIQIPSLSEQQAIAHVLESLDNKIELNSQMSETLEEMAQALFKSWFVDFDPVRAKMEGRDTDLPKHIADLFPNRLVGSELGEIPEGWKVSTIGNELAELISGSRPRGGAVEVGVPSIGAENVIGLGQYDYSKEKYIPTDFFPRLRSKGADVRSGDVLLYKDGAHIGRKTYFDCDFPHSLCAVNEHVFILRLQKSEAQRYLFFWLDQDWITQEIISLNSNSAQPGINKTGVRQLPVVVPSSELLTEFDNRVACLTSRLFTNLKIASTLAALRDALLPKLVSGELKTSSIQESRTG